MENKKHATLLAPSTIFSAVPNFPFELLVCVFGFLDLFSLLHTTQVNKSWYATAQGQLPSRLFEYYNTQVPHAIKDGHLLTIICDCFEQGVVDTAPFFEDYQLLFRVEMGSGSALPLEIIHRQCVQRFLGSLHLVNLQSIPTLMEMVRIFSQSFRDLIALKTRDDDERLMSLQYLNTQSDHAQLHIHFLFDRQHITRFLQHYNRQTFIKRDTIKNHDDLFLAKYLQKAARLEAFLTTLLLAVQCLNLNLDQRWQMLFDKKWSSMLTGDSLFVLESSITIPGLVGDMVRLWSTSPNHKKIAEFFLLKLSSHNLIDYIRAYAYQIDEAVLAYQPQIIATLCQGNQASDTALIHLLLKLGDLSPFFDKIKPVFQLIIRLTHPVFLARFLGSSTYPDDCKCYFAEAILTRIHFVNLLQGSDILLLSKQLLCGASDNLTPILPILFKAGKLTGRLLEELAKLKQHSEYPGAYAATIASSQEACTVLSDPKNVNHAFVIALIALTSNITCYETCQLLTYPQVIQNFNLAQIDDLYWAAKPINQAILEPHRKPTVYSSSSDEDEDEPVLETPSRFINRPAEQSSQVMQFLKKMCLKFGGIAFWFLLSLILILTGGILGGLGMITSPLMISLLTMGSFLLISLIAAKCVLKWRPISTQSEVSFCVVPHASSDSDSDIDWLIHINHTKPSRKPDPFVFTQQTIPCRIIPLNQQEIAQLDQQEQRIKALEERLDSSETNRHISLELTDGSAEDTAVHFKFT